MPVEEIVPQRPQPLQQHPPQQQQQQQPPPPFRTRPEEPKSGEAVEVLQSGPPPPPVHPLPAEGPHEGADPSQPVDLGNALVRFKIE